MNKYQLSRIISGGQTGVDQAALEFAISAGIACGGWCPAGRRSESGGIPDRFPLTENRSKLYPARTRMNVRDSDATLVFCDEEPDGGTMLTVRFASSMKKPVLIVDTFMLSDGTAVEKVLEWLFRVSPKVLNVAGPRLSEAPGLPQNVKKILEECITGSPRSVRWPPAKKHVQRLLIQ